MSDSIARFPATDLFDSLVTPQLCVLQSVVQTNLEAMVQIAGGESSLDRLRPHLKTHKMDAITRMQIDRGIRHFKASTIGELEMAAAAGATSVLLAHQPVGEKINAFVAVCRQYPECELAVAIDDVLIAAQIDQAAQAAGLVLNVFVDVDCGMHRTGVTIGDPLTGLISGLAGMPALRFQGLHVYDGHLHEPELELRRQGVQSILADLVTFLTVHPIDTVIVGGTPTFALWVQAVANQTSLTRWQFSPGTSTLWDWGYGESYDELPFQIAAAVLTRVISKPIGSDPPGFQRICLDLGYKAIASEMPLAERVRIQGLEDATIAGHSEEHLVLSLPSSHAVAVGQTFWAFPKHICPTVSRYDRATLVTSDPFGTTSVKIAARTAIA
ncbi:alanine racemase [Stieleria sp. TO1_6]|uniref:alanine racemase n=1 Tax=Stieleria tagensis TaxID=2956795 RepID=UPI00209B1142|nr:alanine racemase [Stieleria tagensis]MCO8124011.1 alanine racemase [Stieleria tagensis]